MEYIVKFDDITYTNATIYLRQIHNIRFIFALYANGKGEILWCICITADVVTGHIC